MNWVAKSPGLDKTLGFNIFDRELNVDGQGLEKKGGLCVFESRKVLKNLFTIKCLIRKIITTETNYDEKF